MESAWQAVAPTKRDYFFRLSLGGTRPKVSRYHDSEYVRRLNYQLSLEAGAIELYSSCAGQRDLAIRCIENHQESCQILHNLILSNQGIPDTDLLILPMELSILAGKIGFQLSTQVGAATACRFGESIEKLLRRKYLNIISDAPFRDRSKLQHILFLNHANLNSHRSFH